MKNMILAGILAATVSTGSFVSAQDLTVYSAGPGNLINALAADFQAATGVKVNVFQATTGQVMARLEAERSNPNADVLISASWDSAVDLKAQGDLLAYTSANAAMVPDFLKDTHYVAQGVSALAMAWNRGSSVPRPNEWTDLTQAIYMNEVTMPDPAQSGTAFELVAGLITANGEAQTWQLLSDLIANKMIVPGPNARALNPVLQGAKSVVFGAVDYIALGQQANGENIDVIFPPSGTVAAPRPMMILNYSRNQEVAKQFIDFVLSEQGQKRVADVYLMPARTDIPALRPTLTELKLIDIDAELAGARRQEVLDRFRQISGQ